MRVVLDTNVLVSATLLAASDPANCLDHIVRTSTIVVTVAIAAEYEASLRKEKLNRYTELEHRIRALKSLLATAVIVSPKEELSVCRDPSDNKFLEAAIAGEAMMIVTGDADLLALQCFRDVRIVSPASYLAEFAEA